MTSISILHLSDVHYGALSAFQDDAKVNVPEAFRTSAFRNLNNLLSGWASDDPIDAVILSGDLTNRGNQDGFDQFLELTAPALRRLVKDPLSICVVPGNHDVEWGVDSSLSDYFDRKFNRYVDFVAELGGTSCLVPSGALPSSPHAELSFGMRLPGPLFINEDIKLAILCLNSSVRCGEIDSRLRSSLSTPIDEARNAVGIVKSRYPDDDATLLDLSTADTHLGSLKRKAERYSLFDIPHITQTQLNRISEAVEAKKSELGESWRDYVKIATFHHHVVPFEYQKPEYKPFELMSDAAAVLDTLGSHGFQIVLTGHKHQPYVQPVQLMGVEMLVAGGMTVGGYPVPGFNQGIRYLKVTRNNDQTIARISNLPCDREGNLRARIRDQKKRAEEFSIQDRSPKRHWNFPKSIEDSVETQIFQRNFYKENVVFDVRINELENDKLEFVTSLSYDVINLSSEQQEWRMEYTYTLHSGTILQVRFNGEEFDPTDRGIRGGRGLSLPYLMTGYQRCNAFVRVREVFPYMGAVRYTSFVPATNLKVTVRSRAQRFEFDPQVLYPLPTKRSRVSQGVSVEFDNGLLPFQGLQLNWGLKEETE